MSEDAPEDLPGSPVSPQPAAARDDPREILRREAGNTIKPVESVPPPVAFEDSGGDVEGTRLLSGLLTRSPFLDYCCRLADRSYPGKNLQPKVQQLKADHARLYAFCIAADVLLRVVVTVLLIAVGAAVAWKTLAPLPLPE